MILKNHLHNVAADPPLPYHKAFLWYISCCPQCRVIYVIHPYMCECIMFHITELNFFFTLYKAFIKIHFLHTPPYYLHTLVLIIYDKWVLVFCEEGFHLSVLLQEMIANANIPYRPY